MPDYSTMREGIKACNDGSENTAEGTVQAIEGSLQECDWLENLSRDPYYRGLQDKV